MRAQLEKREVREDQSKLEQEDLDQPTLKKLKTSTNSEKLIIVANAPQTQEAQVTEDEDYEPKAKRARISVKPKVQFKPKEQNVIQFIPIKEEKVNA